MRVTVGMFLSMMVLFVAAPAIAQCEVELRSELGGDVSVVRPGDLFSLERRDGRWDRRIRGNSGWRAYYAQKALAGDWIDWNSLRVHNPCSTPAWFSVALQLLQAQRSTCNEHCRHGWNVRGDG